MYSRSLIPLLLTLLTAGPVAGQDPPALRSGDRVRFKIPSSSVRIDGVVREFDGRSLLVWVDDGPPGLPGDTLRVLLDHARAVEIEMRGASEAVAELESGKKIRVREGGRRLEGRLEYAEHGLLQLGGTPALDISTIDSVWTGGTAAGRGALIGGISVGVSSFAFFYWACGALNDLPDEGCGSEDMGAVAMASLVFAAGGSLLGALIGAMVPKWNLRYPGFRPAPPGRLTLSIVPQRRKAVGVGLGIRF